MITSIILVVFDFDGVFTDGKCYFDSSNNIQKYYNIKDGMALSLLKNNNIKTGLISSYNTTKNIVLNCSPDSQIIEHLKFDFTYIGKEHKLSILNNYLKELNISYENVAYIGDDINDIPIMKLVSFSACPQDAVEECKQIVDYVCTNKGGDGCVREFVEVILNKNNTNLLQEIKKELNYQIDNFNLKKIDETLKIIIDAQKQNKNIYFTGIGKSETISNLCCNLLKSISINAFFLNTISALHGDIGTLNENDVLFMFSKSGNTEELINLVPFVKNRKVFIVGICCDKNSKFKKICDYVVELPFKKEIDEDNKEKINKIPTNSTMSMLLFSNILVTRVKEEINLKLDKYKDNHPAGTIGCKLKKIKDCLTMIYPKLFIKENETNFALHNVLLEMTKYNIGCCFFIREDDELFGILTDGDIRRLLIKEENKKIIFLEDINTKYYFEEDTEKYIFECKKVNIIPIINNNRFVGVVNFRV